MVDDLPEPTELDEQLALAFLAVVEATGLQGQPRDGHQCGDCAHYLDPTTSISYCWHPDVRIGVGATHWCRNWAPIPGSD